MSGVTNRAWSYDEDDRLIRMVSAGVKRGDIAIALSRSAEAVARRRLMLQKDGRCPKS